MATDFFDRQDHARRQTRKLVILLVLSVLAIILAIYLVLALAIGEAAADPYTPASADWWWNPLLLLWVAVGTSAVIALGSLYKVAELSSGGEAIAAMLGGRAVNPQTTDLAERQLLNVVEEMALASGVPVPPVYVLDHEAAINAFAAGHEPGDAVVAVSAGCLQYLNREELQGVVGHEFSHILNGDMRLNLRLIGIVYGIMVLAIIGYYLMRSARLISAGSSRKEGNGLAAAAVLFGLLLLVLGYLGVFFGRLIKSAVSRQREFLADASAVQFTRYPGGIAGALKKIGGLDAGSRIRDAHAEEISHMFFGDAFAGSFFNLFATHPPLADRIRALEPGFDGRFPKVRPETIPAVEPPVRSVGPAVREPSTYRGPMPGMTVPAATMALSGNQVTQQVGQFGQEHLRRAVEVREAIRRPLLDAAHEPSLAPAVIYTLLLSRDDEAARSRQLQLLEAQAEPASWRQVQQLMAAMGDLPLEARLPLVDLAIPALKRSSSQQYERFHQLVDALVAADGRLDVFEYCLRTLLYSYLDVHFGRKKPATIRYRTAAAVARPATLLLSTLAYAGQSDPAHVERAFQAGAAGLLGQAQLASLDQCSLRNFDDALTALGQAAPKLKREVLAAVTACIMTDGQVTLKESELLRAVAAALACPLPPMPGR